MALEFAGADLFYHSCILTDFAVNAKSLVELLSTHTFSDKPWVLPLSPSQRYG